MPYYESEPKIDTSLATGWRDNIFRDGFVVVKGSTWAKEHLPEHMKGGMYHGYKVQHEKVIWDARTEPAIIKAFAKLWGTDKLLVSFDGMNLTLPTKDMKPTTPWPHVD
ncbi:hypothetical protein E8E11_010031 [Didymella keratinophila]|nr:hypothetical protein E8E11_010031 [Didymella keratinophila]